MKSTIFYAACFASVAILPAHAAGEPSCRIQVVCTSPGGSPPRTFVFAISGSTFVAHGRLEAAIRQSCGENSEVLSVEKLSCEEN